MLAHALVAASFGWFGTRNVGAGRFDVVIDGNNWFPAGAAPSVRHNGKLYSAADKSLALLHTTSASGADALGPFNSTVWEWALAHEKTTFYVTELRAYADALLFKQSFPVGTSDSATGDKNALVSTFPSFALPSDELSGVGFLSYQGPMVGFNYKSGPWGASSASKIGGGISGSGPLVVSGPSSSVVLSAASNFMAASQNVSSTNDLSYGVMGNVSSIPKGYTIEFLLSYTSEGASFRRAMMEWGDKLLGRAGGKRREDSWASDLTLQRLGYSTDNGAYYYYLTEVGKDYEQTMLDVGR